MALDFPSSPTVGQLFPVPAVAGAPVWKWDGTAWVQTSVAGSSSLGAFSQYEYTATASQTTFSGADINSATLAYTVGYLMVFVNGDKINKADYTATNGTSVVFAVGRSVGDQVTIITLTVATVLNSLLTTNNLSDLTSTNTARQNLGLPSVLRGYLNGLVLSTAGSSATFGIAAGVANDSTFTDFMTLASAYTKTTSAWAVGSGNGAMDTGAVAINTWYHVHLIKRPDTGVVDVLFSLSATAPTLPASYTLFRRIGSMKTNASSQWCKFTQRDDTFLWDADDAGNSPVFNGSVGVTTAVTRGCTVPTGIQVDAIIRVNITGTAACNFLASSLDRSDEAATGILNVSMPAGTGSQTAQGELTIRTNTSAQFRTRASSATANLYYTTAGWIDTRGKL